MPYVLKHMKKMHMKSHMKLEMRFELMSHGVLGPLL